MTRVQNILTKNFKKDDSWELTFITLPSSRSKKHSQPAIIFMVDTYSTFVLKMENMPYADDVSRSFNEVILDSIEQYSHIPKKFVFDSEELRDACAPLALSLQVETQTVKTLPAVAEALSSMREFGL